MALVDSKLLDEIVRRIVGAVHPDKIILFGSRARDEGSKDSDMDILVIAESMEEQRHKRSARLYGLLSDIMVPMDILVYNKAEVEEWAGVKQAFVTTAIREGKTLYENKS